jgi:hypothetical protein
VSPRDYCAEGRVKRQGSGHGNVARWLETSAAPNPQLKFRHGPPDNGIKETNQRHRKNRKDCYVAAFSMVFLIASCSLSGVNGFVI